MIRHQDEPHGDFSYHVAFEKMADVTSEVVKKRSTASAHRDKSQVCV